MNPSISDQPLLLPEATLKINDYDKRKNEKRRQYFKFLFVVLFFSLLTLMGLIHLRHGQSATTSAAQAQTHLEHLSDGAAAENEN